MIKRSEEFIVSVQKKGIFVFIFGKKIYRNGKSDSFRNEETVNLSTRCMSVLVSL